MARGPRKHFKRIRAPKSWLMDKMGGVFAVRPSEGPHALRESIPLQVVLRDKLHFARTGREVDVILHQKEGLVHVDKKVRRNPKYPVGIMDVIDLPKVGAAYRVLYDVKGRFVFTKLKKAEAAFKLCKIEKKSVGANGVTYLVTHDGRTLRFAGKEVSLNDTVKLNLESGEVGERMPMAVNNVAFIVNGSNRGRVGVISHIAHFDGNHDLVTLKDTKGHVFTTRSSYVFVIGNGSTPSIGLPKENGVKKSILEEAAQRIASE